MQLALFFPDPFWYEKKKNIIQELLFQSLSTISSYDWLQMIRVLYCIKSGETQCAKIIRKHTAYSSAKFASIWGTTLDIEHKNSLIL